MVEQEPVKKFSRKDQLMLDETLAFKLHVEEEEERIAREKAQQIKEVNIAWDDVQAKIDADYELAQRLQAEEQDALTDTEKEKLFIQFLKKKRKLFAAKRAKEKRNRPPKKAQQRSIMRDDLEQERSKKQKVEDDKESEELKKCVQIIPNNGDEVTIDATPLSSKEDLEVLWRLVKDRFENVMPVNHMDSFLLHNLKTMFEHHVEDNVWKNQQGLVNVKNWKLYNSCGVHCVTMQNIVYYLLVDKIYPLKKHTLHQMFNNVKLQVDYECEMAYELLRLVKKHIKEGYVS
uniref:Uncharacterized protein n=1 Tax=Tanacetum cinerariifolium TaxID=118510 RepID=A0A6L2NX18_TANCI|nr:hypothetical protein [Tanacetum cinerariifolium]